MKLRYKLWRVATWLHKHHIRPWTWKLCSVTSDWAHPDPEAESAASAREWLINAATSENDACPSCGDPTEAVDGKPWRRCSGCGADIVRFTA